LDLGGNLVRAGHKTHLELPVGRLMSGSPVALPAIVLHGRNEGPIVWLSAAIHGDEIAGTEIIRQVLGRLNPGTMSGTVIALPIVNVYGFNTDDRYLPDRRDLNRSFPGSARGSLASRIAHLLMTEIVSRSTVGIDLHTGSDKRTNLPQIRANLDDPRACKLAAAFGAPIAIHSRTRDGSLRQAASDAGATVLLYEGGEASRFDQRAIDAGTAGVLRVLAHMEMIEELPTNGEVSPQISRRTLWSRATRSGITHLEAQLGDRVERFQPLASIYDPYGKRLGIIRSRASGMVIGHTQHPLVNRGDAVSHVAELDG
jgi:hypothetical protein